MLVSTRQAAEVLAEVGVARSQARALLAAGLAGPGYRSAGAVLHDQMAVLTLADRARVDPEEMRRVCPWGLSLRQELPPWTRALLAARITAYGSLPWVATLCGHVVLGADAVAVHRAPSGDTVFTLTEPGRWWDAFANRVLTTDRGGRPWLVWTPR